MNQLIIVKPGSLTNHQIRLLKKHDIDVIQHENPSEIIPLNDNDAKILLGAAIDSMIRARKNCGSVAGALNGFYTFAANHFMKKSRLVD